MASLIPAISVEDIDNKPERDVARSLVEKLPDNVVVYHSYPWLRSERNDYNGKTTLREGEIDFVLLFPELGFLILEVKGGDIFYDTENRFWYRQLPSGKRRQIKDPFQQANKNTHTLKDLIIEYAFPGAPYPPCAFGYAVVFPDCDFQGTPPPGSEKSIILSSKDIPHLDRRVTEILKKWSPVKSQPAMSSAQYQGIRNALKTSFNLVAVLSCQVDKDEEYLVRLADDQLRLLDFLKDHDRCCIEGVAGSGKTFLAIEQANRFARLGQKTLFVCYNRTLAEWVKASVSEEYTQFIDVYHFHSLCAVMCNLAKIPFKPPVNAPDKFFRSEATGLLLDAIEKVGSKYDAVVVDEGQDFDSQWWLPLELLCHKEDMSSFFLFYDPAQNLYVDRVALPELGNSFPLPINCRNTRRIAAACSSIKKIDIKTHMNAPEGNEVQCYEYSSAEDQLKKCKTKLNELRKGGLETRQIVIQSPLRKENPDSSFKSISKIGSDQIVTDFNDWHDGRGILFTTIRNFKGLEADAVIMVDLPEPKDESCLTLNDLYVGVSRAKHVLVIFTNSHAISSSILESKGS